MGILFFEHSQVKEGILTKNANKLPTLCVTAQCPYLTALSPTMFAKCQSTVTGCRQNVILRRSSYRAMRRRSSSGDDGEFSLPPLILFRKKEKNVISRKSSLKKSLSDLCKIFFWSQENLTYIYRCIYNGG
jgi:hypothetical protein